MSTILRLSGLFCLLAICCITSCRRGHSGSAAPITAGAPLDETPPAIGWYYPENSKIDVPTNTAIVILFVEAMDPTSINSSSIVLTGPSGPVPSSAQLISETTAVLTPDAPMDPLALFSVTVNAGAKDLAGNPFGPSFSWSFTSAALPDSVAPLVVLTNPSEGATGVPFNLSNLQVTFSEAMNPATLTGGSFFLEKAGVPVLGSVVPGVTFAVFLPAAPLIPLTLYTATVTISAKDLAGNPLAVNKVWSFTTGPGLDVTPPTVVLTAPDPGMSGVPINTASIAAIFSEAMNVATIHSGTFTVETGGGPIAGSVSVSGTTTAEFSPAASLLPLTAYTATITTGAQDASGNGLAAPYLWSFTTGPGPDLVPPAVVFTTPTNLATGIALSETVSAAFNEGMNTGSITSSSFQVIATNGLPIGGTVTTSSSTLATFTPSAPFSLLGDYFPSLTTAVKDLAGNSLPATSWSFRSRDGSWASAGVLGANPASGRLDLGMDAAGNALAIWQRDDGPAIDDHIFVRRYQASTGLWSASLQLDSAPTSAINPHIAVNPAGGSFSIWEQNNGTLNYSVLARRFDPGTLTWGPQVTLFTNSLSDRACGPQIAIDAAGNAFAAWLGANTATEVSLHTARYDAGSGSWSAPSLRESSTDPVTSLRIAMNATGDALLVWGQGPGSTATNIYGRRYASSSATWGSATLLDLGAGLVTAPSVALDPAGNGVAVWVQNNGGFQTHANRFAVGSTLWQGDVTLESGGVAAIPSVALDASGNAIAAWESGTPLTRLKASRYSASSSVWSALVTLSDTSGNASTPSVAMAPDGNGLVLWSQRDGVQNNILASRFGKASSTFGAAVFAETAPRNATTPIAVLGGPQNRGMAIWKQLNGSTATSSDLWTNLFQ